MSFNRLAYDAMTYKTNVTQSVGPSDYIMQTPWRQCDPCMSTDSGHGQGHGASSCLEPSMVDVDSELIGITRKASRNPCDMYQHSNKPFCKRSTQVIDCPANNRSEDTRLSNPPCTLRSTGFNRWEWLCQNPQDRVHIPFDTMINSQLIVRDSHRPVLPTPFDPRLALPPDDEAAIHSSGRPSCANQVRTNLPMVSWRSCEEIAKY